MDWVTVVYFSKFQLVAIASEPVVNIEHKGVKVRPPFAHDRATGEKQVHQHSLAAADIAPNVKPLEGRLGAFALAEQPAQRRRFASQPMNGKSAVEAHQLGYNCLLCGIAFDL